MVSRMNERSFFLLRMILWLVLLLSAWGILQYCTHAWAVLQVQRVQPVDSGTLWWLLGWDALYLLVAGVIVMAASGCLMWRPWARPLLRGVVFALAVYSLAGAVLLFAQWWGSDPAGMAMIAQHMDPVLARAVAARHRRILLMGAALKALAAPLLAWLGWRLGQAEVVRRFAR